MSLAHRLNQLAAAHEQNLISDDDYRLLRRDLFERFGSEPQTPPPPAPTRHQAQHQPSSAPPTPLPLTRKQSVVSNVANLFRRATGRSSKKQEPQPTQQSRSHTPTPQKRIRHKPSLLPTLRPDQQQQQPPPPEVQDQDDPSALRTAIASAEAEYTRLREAFIALETSTLKRIEYKTARRLYTPTPTNVNVLIEGRDWRKHTRPVPSIVLPPSTSNSNSRSHPSRMASASSDQQSIHSTTSSSKLSISRSFSSAPRSPTAPHPPLSPLSPHFRSPSSLRRQNSVSSASTHSTGTSSRLALGPRSTGNLYLSSLAERASADTVADSRVASDDADIDNDDPEAADYESAVQELNGIRRRREELDARYHTKLEYLKAKLKAAELRERVLRR